MWRQSDIGDGSTKTDVKINNQEDKYGNIGMCKTGS